MSPIGRIFPQIYTVSFQKFLIKSLAVILYVIVLSVIFGFFVGDGSGESLFGRSGPGVYPPGEGEVSYAFADRSDRILKISQEDQARAMQSRAAAKEVVREKAGAVQKMGGIDTIVIEKDK